MDKFKLVFLLNIIIILGGCTTGQNALEQGNYATAVYQSTERLKSDPGNPKATTVLERAYPEAEQYHLENIEIAKNSSQQFRWEKVSNNYVHLNKIAEAVRSSQSARNIIPDPTFYYDEMLEASEKAAQARIDQGDKFLESRAKDDAKIAFKHFNVAKNYLPNSRQIDSKIADAKKRATLTVNVLPISNTNTKLENASIVNSIASFFKNQKQNEFLRFKFLNQSDNSKTNADSHVIQITIDDFIKEKTDTKKDVDSFIKENIVIGYTKDNPPKEVFGNVQGKVYLYNRVIESTAGINFKITSSLNGKIIHESSIYKKNAHEDKWGTYQGDLRAVPDNLKKVVVSDEPKIPSNQILFYENMKPVLSDFYNQINAFYQNY